MILIIQPKLQFIFKTSKPHYAFFGENAKDIRKYELPLLTVWTTNQSKFAEFTQAFVNNPSLDWVQSVRLARKKAVKQEHKWAREYKRRLENDYKDRLNKANIENRNLREKIHTLTETIKGLEIIRGTN